MASMPLRSGARVTSVRPFSREVMMRDVLILHRTHEGGIVHALALGVEERAFEMDAENARHAGIDRRAHGLDRFRHASRGCR